MLPKIESYGEYKGEVRVPHDSAYDVWNHGLV
jgi:hypothetical protein